MPPALPSEWSRFFLCRPDIPPEIWPRRRCKRPCRFRWSSWPGTSRILEAAHFAEERVVQALMAVSEGESPDTRAALSCNAAYAAVNAAVLALQSVKAPSRATEGSKVIAAAVTAADAAMVVDPDIRHKMIRDYQILCRLNLGRFPDWGRAFDASEEGTLGPLQLTRDAETAKKQKSLIHV